MEQLLGDSSVECLDCHGRVEASLFGGCVVGRIGRYVVFRRRGGLGVFEDVARVFFLVLAVVYHCP